MDMIHGESSDLIIMKSPYPCENMFYKKVVAISFTYIFITVLGTRVAFTVDHITASQFKMQNSLQINVLKILISAVELSF